MKPEGASNTAYGCHCGCTIDGGFAGPHNDTIPLNNDVTKLQGGTRMMSFGPHNAAKKDIAPDTVPHGGQNTAKKLLYSRTDRPWTGTAPGKAFSGLPYKSGPKHKGPGGPGAGAGPNSGGGLDDDWGDDEGRRLKGPRGPQGPGRQDALDTFMAPPPPAAMKCGKVQHPCMPYPHMANPVADNVSAAPSSGLNLKTGKGPGTFDQNPYAGAQMISAPAERVPQQQPIGRMKTNMPKKDTFGAYPAHMADPYQDDPLASLDKSAKGKRNPVIKTQNYKPQMPIVNVWDAPIGLQTKAGIKKGHAKITGEKTNYLSDKGRLGTTV
uniref:Uncharacterized protein n=1 Tax=Eutreptiella gymnastica TaxID=73025 RepID=A0A7S4LFQ5_9EUGL|mmetsp:Transcript_28008/g.47454  ORF Transcript_28008/g.47454 Transcript_28008/m.47454 type:complete len:324 (+) Transcript_28008:35-1006(+)